MGAQAGEQRGKWKIKLCPSQQKGKKVRASNGGKRKGSKEERGSTRITCKVEGWEIPVVLAKGKKRTAREYGRARRSGTDLACRWGKRKNRKGGEERPHGEKTTCRFWVYTFTQLERRKFTVMG